MRATSSYQWVVELLYWVVEERTCVGSLVVVGVVDCGIELRHRFSLLEELPQDYGRSDSDNSEKRKEGGQGCTNDRTNGNAGCLSLSKTTITVRAGDARDAIALTAGDVEGIGRRTGSRGEGTVTVAVRYIVDLVAGTLDGANTGASLGIHLIEGRTRSSFVAREISEVEWTIRADCKGAVVVVFVATSRVIFETQRNATAEGFPEYGH